MNARTAASAGCALLFLLVAAAPVPAQPEGARRPGLLRGIRQRLIPPNAQEAWAEARALPSALEVLPLMENLARRDAPESGPAALWLGHFYYGAGDAESALAWFEKASAGAGTDAERAEARFWTENCRNLGGAESPGAPVSPGEPASAFEEIARADAALRAGEATRAREAWLGLESAARQAGVLGPLVYRLVRLAWPEDDPAGAYPAERTAAWNAATGPSPERALVRALQAGRREPAPPVRAEAPALFAVPAESLAADAPAAPVAAESVPATAEPEPPPAYAVQLGSFADARRAELEAGRLRELGLPVRLEEETSAQGPLYKVRWGVFRSREEAEESAQARCTGLAWTIARVPSEP